MTAPDPRRRHMSDLWRSRPPSGSARAECSVSTRRPTWSSQMVKGTSALNSVACSPDQRGPRRGAKSSRRARAMADALRAHYEQQAGGTSSWVQLVGCQCPIHLAAVVPALLALDLDDQARGHAASTRLGKDGWLCDAELAVVVQRSIAGQANWLSVNDRVGWVDRKPEARIGEAVRERRVPCPPSGSARGLGNSGSSSIATRS